ncbi:MAG TPA: GNAT family N-acetyltransferase [Nocardioidaceae bacterium]|nr:GNAT family N-acetyltransferase [Nocardioidaceae bacterium]
MARKLARLTLDNLGDLPEAVQECVFWELDPVARSRAEHAGEARSEKEAWLSHVLLEWGSCGRVAYVDGEPVGFVLYAPPVFFPGSAQLPTAPIGEDAVQLATAYVDPEHAGGGLGRVLLQAMVKDLLKRGDIRAVEAFGTQRPHDCVLPVDFLVRCGFKTQRAHPRTPRMRMELKSVLTWKEDVEAALERLVGVVRPVKVRPSTQQQFLPRSDVPPARRP